MEYIFNFFYDQIEYFVNETFMPKQKLIRINEEEDCSEEINKLMDVIEKEIKFDKEMELLKIRYENLVKDVEDMKKEDEEEDEDNNDDKKNNNNNNNNNGKMSLLA
jgi:hypothetical protein